MSIYYVPAGFEDYYNKYLVIYGKNKKHDQESTDFVGKSTRIWKTNEHQYTQVSSSFKDPVLPKESYDYCTCLMSPAYLKMNKIEMCLVNPFVKNITNSSLRDLGIQVIADSGGFQFITDTTDFIDPLKLVKAYNRCANLGMDLDIPLMPGIGMDLIKACAKIQTTNRELFEEHVNRKVNLVTIIHGRNIDERKLWIDLIGNEDSEYVSIGGMLRMPPSQVPRILLFLEHILLVLSRYKKINYLHCLGVTGTDAFFVYSLLHHLGLVKNIGGDSVSHIMSSAAGDTYTLFPWKTYHRPQSFHMEVEPSCSCPVCRTFSDLRFQKTTYVSASHALYVKEKRKKYVVTLTDLMLNQEISLREYLALVNLKTSHEVIHQAIEYAQDFKATGKWKPIKLKKNSLFASSKPKERLDPMMIERVTKVVKNYEKYYQKGFL